MTIKECHNKLLMSLKKLYEHGEAEFIAKWVFEDLGIMQTDMVLDPGAVMEEEKLSKVMEYKAKLEKFVPLQYVLGYSLFDDLRLSVSPACLIPRPETEEMVSLLFREKISYQRILDMGTGSGCIAISLKRRYKEAEVFGVDISDAALKLAAGNAEYNNARVIFLKMDILNPAYNKPMGKFDLIISNPPYVKESEKSQMHNNVLEHEPFDALFVPDSDPLIFYRAIAEYAKRKLETGGRIIMEINEAHGSGTAGIFEGIGFGRVEIVKDMQAKDRFLKVNF